MNAKLYGWIGALLIAASFTFASAQPGAPVAVDPDDIGGIVSGPRGPEAGVWVVAETTGLPNRFTRIAVTDDRGRYVVPDLPKANYEVFVRGYGLVDSPRVKAVPGKPLSLRATPAPSSLAAAQIYPASYWLSLMAIPPGKAPPPEMRVHLAECMPCHQMGSRATREIPESLGRFATSLEAWDRRVRSGQQGSGMSASFQRLGAQRSMFAAWTDRILAGDHPKVAPPRPSGVERNLVITTWDWGRPTSYLHDEGASDKRDPRVLANGLVYGAVQSDDTLAWVNPVDHTTGEIPVPTRDTPAPDWPGFGDAKNTAPSPYWGDQPIWSAMAQPRNATPDQLGRIWLSVQIRSPRNQPAFCKPGSTHPSAKYFPISQGGNKQIAVYDPKAKTFALIDTCFPTEHFEFAEDATNTIFSGQGSVIGWVDTKAYDATKDEQSSQGWCPGVVDTNGDGKITEWTEPDQPLDPKKDLRLRFGCYGIAINPVDGAVWCSRPDTRLVRIERGANPPQSCRAEVYEPPAGSGILDDGGVDVDSTGVVWANWRGSDHVTSFDRRKCKVLNGPTATGQHCPEGWTIYKTPGPTLQGTDFSADLTYLQGMDRFDTLGLGTNVPLTFAVNSDSLLALPPPSRQWVRIRVPYPLGFFPRSVHGRVDDPGAGWKGKGMWSNISMYSLAHMESGKGSKSKLVKFQFRPDPLAK